MHNHVKRNFILFAVHTILFRVGWLFKTESVIVPAVARLLGANNFLIGFFPMFMRLGETLPQIFAAGYVQPLPRKKPYLMLSGSLFFLLWFLLFLAFIQIPYSRRSILLLIFLLIYVLFWTNLGVFALLNNIIIGKTIPYNIRGKLISVAGMVSGIAAVIVTFTVIQPVLHKNFQSVLTPYSVLFFICSILFLLSFIFISFIKEPPITYSNSGRTKMISFITQSFSLIKKDRNFLIFFLVSSIAMCGFGLLAFYTMYAKNHLAVPDYVLAYYLAVQVGGNSLGSLFYGFCADRFGNRMVIRMIILTICLTPLTAVIIGTAGALPHREYLYCLVFFMVGFNLPIYQILVNYLLEIAPLQKHPNYLGIYSAMSSLFFVFPLAMGFLMDKFYYNKVFIGITLFLAIGVILSVKLIEPRHLRDKSRYKKEIPLG
jgi:MFS-type transporter involved in bile tolerance (Atg22 family)